MVLYSLLQRAQHHPPPSAVPPALYRPHPGDGLQHLDTGLPAAATLAPRYKPPVCPCSGREGAVELGEAHRAMYSPSHPCLPGPTPMYCSARQ